MYIIYLLCNYEFKYLNSLMNGFMKNICKFYLKGCLLK